ncbi:hypothetical protein D9M69_196790 [compost metagenome]
MLLLRRAHAVPEQAGLGEMIGEAGRTHPDLAALHRLMEGREAAVARRRRRLPGPVAVDGIRLVGSPPAVDLLAMRRVALVVVERTERLVDRDLVEVRPAEAQQLRVGIGEQPALHQRVVAEIDARHDVADVEGHLLGLGEEVVGVAVQHHAPHHPHRHQFLGDQLGRVEQVEAEAQLVLFLHHLQAQLPFRVVAALDVLPQAATVEVRVLAGELLRLVPDQRADARLRPPVELHQARLALVVDQPEAVHAEPLHGAEAHRDGAVGHGPEHHVRRLRRQRDEVPEGVVGRGAGGDLVVRLGFHRVDEVGELDGVLDEEHRHVVADQVEVALVGIELHREAAHVAHRVGGTARPLHRGEAHEHRRALARLAEEVGPGQVAQRLRHLEVAMGRRATGMYHPLGNPLVVEVGDLLPHDEVFQQGRTPLAGAQAVLVVGDARAGIGGQRLVGGVFAEAFELVQLGVAIAAVQRIGAGHLAGGSALLLFVFHRAVSSFQANALEF